MTLLIELIPSLTLLVVSSGVIYVLSKIEHKENTDDHDFHD